MPAVTLLKKGTSIQVPLHGFCGFFRVGILCNTCKGCFYGASITVETFFLLQERLLYYNTTHNCDECTEVVVCKCKMLNK